MTSPNSNSIKCCIIGSCNVGKTSIIQHYMKNTHDNTDTTLGAIYWLIEHHTSCGTNIKLDFWDTAGQERYSSLIPMYCRNSDIILLTYDITEKNSFLDLKKWLDTIFDNNSGDCKIIIIGNKIDLDFYRQIEVKEVKQFIRESFNKNILYMETSAQNGKNIPELFENIFKIGLKIIKKKNQKSKTKIMNKSQIVDIVENNGNCCLIQ